MKKVIALVLVLIMAVSVVACGTQAETPATAAPATDGSAVAPAAEAEKASIKFGNTQSETDLQSQSLLAVCDKLAEATDGNFTAECFFSSSLGETDDILEQALQGAAVLHHGFSADRHEHSHRAGEGPPGCADGPRRLV